MLVPKKRPEMYYNISKIDQIKCVHLLATNSQYIMHSILKSLNIYLFIYNTKMYIIQCDETKISFNKAKNRCLMKKKSIL